MKSREQSLFAGLLQKQSRTQLAIILGVAAMLRFQKLPTGSNWKHS